MEIDWNDPRVVDLHERLAACVQRGFEDSITAEGRVADAQYLGARVATDILQAAVAAAFSDAGVELTFLPGPVPRTDAKIFCVYCTVGEGQLHHDYCSRTGVLRYRDQAAAL